MAVRDVEISNVKSYTEATCTAYADVTGADPIGTEPGRTFTPGRITVHYNWRTHLLSEGWSYGNIEISGRWLNSDGPGSGSGMVIVSASRAPEWAREFAAANLPSSTLVGAEPWPAKS